MEKEGSSEGRKTHLLCWALSNCEEVGNVGRGQDLVLGRGVLFQELGQERLGLVELGVRLERRDLDAALVDVREALLNTSDPVTDKVAERNVDPALLLRYEHEPDEASVDFGVGQVGEVARRSIGPGGELKEMTKKSAQRGGLCAGRRGETHPGLLEVGVEAVDHVLLLGGEPSGLLLTRESKDGPSNSSNQYPLEKTTKSKEGQLTCRTRPTT